MGVMAQKKFNVLPGFGLTMGFTLFYLSAIVLIPFAGLVIRALRAVLGGFLAAGDDGPRAGGLPADLRRLVDCGAWPTRCSARCWPGCWCATSFPGAGSSMRWWISPLPCRRRWRG